MDNFDFNEWAMLAKTAPDEFEKRRRSVVENLISSSDNTRRLRGLQCSIDLERIRARTPLKACLRLSTLMSDAFLDMNTALNSAVELNCEKINDLFHSVNNEKIIHIETARKLYK
jgi:hypothetical protein